MTRVGASKERIFLFLTPVLSSTILRNGCYLLHTDLSYLASTGSLGACAHTAFARRFCSSIPATSTNSFRSCRYRSAKLRPESTTDKPQHSVEEKRLAFGHTCGWIEGVIRRVDYRAQRGTWASRGDDSGNRVYPTTTGTFGETGGCSGGKPIVKVVSESIH